MASQPPLTAGSCPTGDDENDPITLVGLVIESAGGLRRRLSPLVEHELGVGGLAFEVLVRLERSPGGALRMSDLAAQTGLTPSGLTRALDRLVEGGLCLRESCASDRRGTFALLTDAGRGRVAETLARHRHEIELLLEDLYSTEEHHALCEAPGTAARPGAPRRGARQRVARSARARGGDTDAQRRRRATEVKARSVSH